MELNTQPKMYPALILPILILVICSLSCDDNNQIPDEIEYEYAVPARAADGWEVASLTEVGIDEAPLFDIMNEFLNNVDHQVHSILIIKDGKLVFEEYFSGYAFYHGALTGFNRDTKHNLASVTKSITSALVGIAIDKDFIQGVNQKVFSFFPEYNDLLNEDKDKITIEHLLTMTSGLEWDESTYPYSDSRNYISRMHSKEDPIRFILENPVMSDPGTQFLYSSGSTLVLGEIIRKATGMRADDFATEYLFTPLGITDFQWIELSNDVLFTSGDLKLRPRDMAKFGDLFLQNGRWKGQQIVSEWWVEESVKPHISADPDWVGWDYGYKWWLYTFEINSDHIESYFASGWGGQHIVLFPSLDMVVVTTAGYYDDPQLEFHIGGLLMPKILDSAL